MAMNTFSRFQFKVVTWRQFLSQQCVVHPPKKQFGRGLALAVADVAVAVAEGAADPSPAQAHRGFATVEDHQSLFLNKN